MSRAAALAVAMEQSAIRMYERASLLLEGETAACAKKLLRDEYSHLRDFRRLAEADSCDDAEGLLTAAEGEAILFPGGLTQAAREGALDGEQTLLRAAMDAEQKSIAYYTQCADFKNTDAAERELFAIVAKQEQEHLRILQERFRSL